MTALQPSSYPPTLLDENALRAGIAGLRRFSPLFYASSMDSTNELALKHLSINDHDSISIVTEWQAKGRGRAGRSWTAPAGSSLLCSTVLPGSVPRASLPAIGFWAALALADAIQAVSGACAAFKWPNDLLVGEAKCAGILIESRSMGDIARAVVGVGVNVNRPASVPPDIADAGWLSDAAARAIDRTELAIELLRRYDTSVDRLTAEPAGVIREWWQRSELLGRHVIVMGSEGDTLCDGAAVGLTNDGALLVRTDSHTRTVRLGDVWADGA